MGLRKKAAKKLLLQKKMESVKQMCVTLTGSLQLLHPPELVHRVVQASDPVVVEKKKSEAGQMVQSP